MKHMEKDVGRNLKWYSVVEALRSGRLPSNAQLDVILGQVIDACPNPDRREADKWSADTLATLSHFRKLLETLRVVVKEKNADELFQDTLWLMFVESFPRVTGFQLQHSNGTAHKDKEARGNGNAGTDSEATSLHAIDRDLTDLVDTTAVDSDVREGELAEGARHIRTLATIFVTNSDLRHAIGDVIAVGRKIVRSKKPKDQAVAETSKEAAANNPPSDLGHAPAAPQAEAGTDDEDDMPHIPGAWGSGNGWDDSGSETEVDRWEVTAENPLSIALRKNPRLRDFIVHFKAAIIRLQAHPGYVESMTWLIDVFETYENEAFATKFPNKAGPKNETPDNSLKATRHILYNIILLLQRFARSGKSVSPVQRAIHKLYEDILVTPQLRSLWTDIDAFIRRILLENGFIETEECAEQGQHLYARADLWLNNTVYWAHWNAVLSGLSIWLGYNPGVVENEGDRNNPPAWFYGDPLTMRMEKDWSNLVHSLFLDSRKHFHIKGGLWKDLGGILFPSVQGFGYITFPRVEYVSPGVELVLENINISLANLLPTYVSLEWHDFLKYSPIPEARKACSTGTHSWVRLRASQIQGEVRDAMVAFKWMKGITVQDMGLVDIILSRYGVSLDLELEINTRDDSDFIIRVKKITFTIDEVAMVPHKLKSGHDGLYYFVLKTIAIPLLKRKLTGKWATKLTEKIDLLNTELLALREQWSKVSKRAERDIRRGRSAPGATARFLQVAQDRFKVWSAKKTAHNLAVERQVRRFRRLSSASEASAVSGASDVDPLPEPGGDKPKPFKKFRISSNLKDTLLPHVSYDKSKSLVWRRRRTESSARRTDEAVAAVKTASRTVAVTATGFSQSNTSKPWRSPVFNFA